MAYLDGDILIGTLAQLIAAGWNIHSTPVMNITDWDYIAVLPPPVDIPNVIRGRITKGVVVVSSPNALVILAVATANDEHLLASPEEIDCLSRDQRHGIGGKFSLVRLKSIIHVQPAPQVLADVSPVVVIPLDKASV